MSGLKIGAGKTFTCKHLLQGVPDCVFCHRDQLQEELRVTKRHAADRNVTIGTLGQAISELQARLAAIEQERLTWAMDCECYCPACTRLDKLIRGEKN